MKTPMTEPCEGSPHLWGERVMEALRRDTEAKAEAVLWQLALDARVAAVVRARRFRAEAARVLARAKVGEVVEVRGGRFRWWVTRCAGEQTLMVYGAGNYVCVRCGGTLPPERVALTFATFGDA